jgi:PH (Pleckstrin Homology) domain-containing protein
MTYKSKKDTWLIAVIVSSVVVSILAGASLILFSPSIWERFLGLIIMFAVLVPVLLVNPTSYTIDNASLHVRGGYKHWAIPVKNILAVRPSREWIASPALSLDRLEIIYKDLRGTSSLLISPDRSDQFLEELVRIDTRLISEQGRLSRQL